jgi:hypothetical protein
MSIPISVTGYTTTIRGWVWKPVRCEACGCEFAYRLQVKGTAAGYTPFNLAKTRAKQAGQDIAQRNREKAAQKDIAAVNCPQCGQLQPNMVKKLKTQRWKSVGGIALALAVADFFDFLTGAKLCLILAEPQVIQGTA